MSAKVGHRRPKHCRPKHVHEFLGSVMNARPPGEEEFHNHRFTGVSGPAEYEGRCHVHLLKTRTDFYEDHYHFIDSVSGPQIDVFDENHVLIGHTHGFTGATTVNDKHNHVFKVATLIEDPLGPAEEDDGRWIREHPKREKHID